MYICRNIKYIIMCETKICNDCKIEKSTGDFETIKNNKTGVTTLYSICRVCKYKRRNERNKIKNMEFKLLNSLPEKEKPVKIKKEYIYTEDGYKDLRVLEKKCFKCNEIKGACDFTEYRNLKNKTIKLYSYCRSCQFKKQTEKRKIQKPDSKLVHNKRSLATARQGFRHLAKKAKIDISYDFLTLDWYEDLVKSQKGCCAICGKSSKEKGRKLFIDHCHITGKVRGLLCSGCNTALGKLGDNLEGVKKALAYLLKSEEK